MPIPVIPRGIVPLGEEPRVFKICLTPHYRWRAHRSQ